MEGRIFTESEKSDICMMYRQAKYPDVQIEILADLYDCTKKDILRVLNASRNDTKPKIQVQDEESRIELIKRVINKELTTEQAANIRGVSADTIRRWVSQYKNGETIKIRPKRSGYQRRYYQKHREKMLAAANKRNREKREADGKSA